MQECALDLSRCMLSQDGATGLQTGCMDAVLAHMDEAARLLQCMPYSPTPWVAHPCNNNARTECRILKVVDCPGAGGG